MHGHTSIDWKRWYIFITYINFFLWWVHSSCPFRQEMQEIIASLSPTSPFPPQATSCRPLSRTEREWPYLPWEESERVGGLTPYRGSLLIKFWRTKNLGFIQIWEHRCPFTSARKRRDGKRLDRAQGSWEHFHASCIPNSSSDKQPCNKRAVWNNDHNSALGLVWLTNNKFVVVSF